jgi:hypothetical protein
VLDDVSSHHNYQSTNFLFLIPVAELPPIYVHFTTLSAVHITQPQMTGSITTNEMKRTWQKAVVAYFNVACYTGVSLEEERKITKHLRKDGQPRCLDLNCVPAGYGAGHFDLLTPSGTG